MTKQIKIGLSAVAAFAFFMATSISVLAHDTAKAPNDKVEVMASTGTVAFAQTLAKLNTIEIKKQPLAFQTDTLWFPVSRSIADPTKLDITGTPQEELAEGCDPEADGDECAVQFDLSTVLPENQAQLNNILANPTNYTTQDLIDIGATEMETAYHENP